MLSVVVHGLLAKFAMAWSESQSKIKAWKYLTQIDFFPWILDKILR